MKTFADKVYDLLKRVPKGRVTTYKELAHALDSKAYRGVGQALRTNPHAPEVP
jgi:methylated-DNA-[protein]-cysteine S-methyltransferase